MKIFFPLLFSFILGASAFAEAFKVPALTGPVVDQAQLLSPQAKQYISQKLIQFNQNQKAQIQVLVVESLGGDAIESVAIQVFDQWKLGDEKKDDGILFLIAPNEKKLRIEVGQGMEGVIPDITAKRIIADIVRPYFSQGQFDEGTLQGISALITKIDSGDLDFPKTEKAKTKESKGGWVIFLLLGLWVLIFIISPSTAIQILFFAMSSGRGGESGGGSWSGGGGRSSGGGASGDW